MHNAMVVDERREEILDLMAQELFASSSRRFVPMFPWVFVRVLPKRQTLSSGLILPPYEQNKTIHEGIVLATWKPHAAPVASEGDAEIDWRSKRTTTFQRSF